jgi:hypothetical protein
VLLLAHLSLGQSTSIAVAKMAGDAAVSGAAVAWAGTENARVMAPAAATRTPTSEEELDMIFGLVLELLWMQSSPLFFG